MAKIVISGGEPLNGEVQDFRRQERRAADPCRDPAVRRADGIGNVPHLHDVTTTMELLGQMGAQFIIDERMRVHIDRAQGQQFHAPYDLVKTMRASILVLGPLVARFGEAEVSLPGGCAIGSRPVNLHIKRPASTRRRDHGRERLHPAKAKRLKGARIVFDLVTVTGTENIMMAAALAQGTT
jgi:UDP-N-acetylglucosamine 1-carboxyvinyltransferase